MTSKEDSTGAMATAWFGTPGAGRAIARIFPSRKITVQRLSSGFYRIQGRGPCEWAQVETWPCSEEELRRQAFPEASEAFIRAAMSAAGKEGNHG